MSREEVITNNGGPFNPDALPECPFRKHLELNISRIERLGQEMNYHYRQLGLSAFDFEVVFTNSTFFHPEMKKAGLGKYLIIIPAGFYMRLFAAGYLLFYLSRNPGQLPHYTRPEHKLDIKGVFSRQESIATLYASIDKLLPEEVKQKVSKDLIYALETSLYFEFFHHLGAIQKQQVEFTEKIIFSGNYKRVNLSLEDLHHGLELNADLFGARMTISYLLDRQKKQPGEKLKQAQVQRFLKRLSFAFILRFLVNELHNNLGVSMRRYKRSNPFLRMLFSRDFGKLELQDHYSAKLANYWEEEFNAYYRSMMYAANAAFTSPGNAQLHNFPDSLDIPPKKLEQLQNDTLHKLDMVNMLLGKFKAGDFSF